MDSIFRFPHCEAVGPSEFSVTYEVDDGCYTFIIKYWDLVFHYSINEYMTLQKWNDYITCLNSNDSFVISSNCCDADTLDLSFPNVYKSIYIAAIQEIILKYD
jgi:hypothetical protein